jgi:hypothetical protein
MPDAASPTVGEPPAVIWHEHEPVVQSDEEDTRQAAPPAAPVGRYGILLLVLITTYLLSAFTSGKWISALQILLFTGVALLALRNSSASQRTFRLAIAVAVVSLAIMPAITLTSHTGAGIASIWKGLILLFAVAVIVHRVLSSRTVSLQSIYGALSAYLVIGLMFAAFFTAIGDLSAEDFFAHSEKASVQTYQYFSFTTLTTLGYGDFTAASSGGQATAVLEALTGQIFLVTLVASLVAGFRRPNDRDS